MLNYEDTDQTLLDFYNVDLFDAPPRPWDDVDALRLAPPDQQCDALNRLLRHSTDTRTAPDNLQDPLSGGNLVETLVRSGAVGSEADPALQRYLVLSLHFNSQAYLSVVHRDTPIERLMALLDGLDRSIRGQTSELKLVLDANFESFVACKRAMDDVLVQFKSSKLVAQKDMERSKVFNPAAQRNRRKIEAGESLLAELEESINNLNMLSLLMIRPIMDHHAKETKVLKLIDFVQNNRFLFNLPVALIRHLAAHDHDAFIDDYNRFLKERDYIDDRHRRALAKAQAAGDDDAVRAVKLDHNIENTALDRVYREVEGIATEYRKKAFRELLSLDHEVSLRSNRKLALEVKFIDLVDKLHRMNADAAAANPIFEFLSSQLDRMGRDLNYQHDKFGSKFALMQQRLQDYIFSLPDRRDEGSFVRHIAEKFESAEEFFQASSTTQSLEIDAEKEQTIISIFENSENLDLSIINETWLVLANFVKYVEEFFDVTVSKFVNNYVHYADPKSDYNIDPEGILRTSFFRMVDDVVQRMLDIFQSSAPTDQMRVAPSNYSNFLPYHTNSLSAIFYLTDISQSLSSILSLIGKYTLQIGNTHKSIDTNKQIKGLRESSSQFDQKILEAVCSTWVNDCSQFYDLENWERYKSSKDAKTRSSVYTKQIQMLYYYELFVLQKLANLLIDRDIKNEDVRIVATYPSKRVLVSLEIQFMRSMKISMDSVMKKFTLEKTKVDAETLQDYHIEQCIYKVLTMNNYAAMGDIVFPKLIMKFDKLFEKTLLQQNLKLFAELDQAKIAILDDINVIERAWIEFKIETHFANVERSDYAVQPIEIDPFVYESLMHFVKLVHVLKPITDLDTFVAIIQQLQTHFLLKFLTCLRTVSEKTQVIVHILGNVKIDLDFFVEVFEASETLRLDDYCLNLVKIIVGQIERVEGMFKDLGYTQRDIEARLNRALQHSENEFSCFV